MERVRDMSISGAQIAMYDTSGTDSGRLPWSACYAPNFHWNFYLHCTFFRTCTVLVLFSLFCPDFCSSSICWCAQWTSTSSWSPAPTPPDHMRAVLGYSTPLQLTRASQQSQLPGSQYQPALSFSFILEKGPFFQTIQLYHDWLVNWLSVKKFIFGHI